MTTRFKRETRRSVAVNVSNNPKSKARFALYGGQDPRELPAYPIPEAARAVGVPPATLRWWVKGRDTYPPAIILPDEDKSSLSYINLIEAHVLASMRRMHNVPLPNVRSAINYLEKKLHVKHALAFESFETDGLDLFVQRFSRTINVTRDGQLEMREIIEANLKRVKYDEDGAPFRFFPFVRRDRTDDTQLIEMNPFISFGRPVITGTRIPTSIVAERFIAGESIDELADDYGREKSEIEEAIRYEQVAA